MNKGVTFTIAAALAVAMVLPASVAEAQSKSSKKTTSAKKSSSKKVTGPENSLVGIRIYDDALRVLSMYGNPDTITAVSVASNSSTGDGGGGGRGGFGGAPTGAPGGGAGRSGSGGSGAPMKPSSDSMTDFIPGSFLDGPTTGNYQGMPGKGGGPRGGPPTGAPPGAGRGSGGAGTMDGAPGMPGGAPGGPGGPGGPGASSNETTEFTRWTYTRNGTKLGFVIDKFNRVIQIEAIGLQNAQVRTKRGVGFGSSFSNVMNAYAPSQEPDGYDLNGDNFTIRFLTRARVAFRLTRLSTKKSHVVTGIVVAAGKK